MEWTVQQINNQTAVRGSRFLPVFIESLLAGFLSVEFFEGPAFSLARQVQVLFGLLHVALLGLYLGFRLLLLGLVVLTLLLVLLALLLLFLLAFLELFLAERQVVAGVVILGVQAERLFIMVDGNAQQLLLLLGQVERLRLAYVAAVVPCHGAYLAVLLGLRNDVVQAVGRLRIVLRQIGIGQVKGSAGIVRILFECLQVVLSSLLVLAGVEAGIALVHQPVLGGLGKGGLERKEGQQYEQAAREGTFHSEYGSLLLVGCLSWPPVR